MGHLDMDFVNNRGELFTYIVDYDLNEIIQPVTVHGDNSFMMWILNLEPI